MGNTETKPAATRAALGAEGLRTAPRGKTTKRATSPKDASPRGPKAANEPATGKKPAPCAAGIKTEASIPREFSKKSIVLDLLKRKGGATLEEIATATDWQKHTIRGFMSTLPKKTGLKITSSRRESDKARVYEAMK